MFVNKNKGGLESPPTDNNSVVNPS